tara:strand:+ start:1367 stop:1783 length:417 start_codon:yes stop_codon:yes gene_type:complete
MRIKTVDKAIHIGPLNRLLDSSIVIAKDTIPLSEIKTVYLEDKAKGAEIVSDVLITAGLGYAAISTTNRIINDDAPIVHRSAYQFGAVAFGLGMLIKATFNPKVRIKKTTQLKIINLSLAVNIEGSALEDHEVLSSRK